eukprot:TRINITY_DN4394_c0_g2_i2.p1 TRINITY_DN4394_c0_g2~~TRINITY_DN4394_c0_g2_i2.p1  ORF type:complete len:692 (+),score=132.91 TRINITY_DN4394_c0_g2_i2:110-2185(+)
MKRMKYMNSISVILLLVLFCCGAYSQPSKSYFTYSSLEGKPYNVSWEQRALLINDAPAFFLSGSIHYPRFSPDMWDSVFKHAKQAGLNAISTYVFWNIHEPVEGAYIFSERANLTLFLELAKANDLFVILRLGPFVCAEFTYGGFPIWLREIPGIEFRTYNQPFMDYMSKFLYDFVGLAKPYLAVQGGPIILLQIENEYADSSPAGLQYVEWLGEIAAEINPGIPWIMCHYQAANGTIKTMNGCGTSEHDDDGTKWIENHWKALPGEPSLWTEVEGGYERWGGPVLTRPVADLAYAITRWFAAGGSLANYYMFAGGNNYERTAGAMVVTRYENDVFLDSFMVVNQPKFNHMTSLHKVLISYADVLLAEFPSKEIELDNPNTTVRSYGNETLHFISNNDFTEAYTVTFKGQNFALKPFSVQILDSSLGLVFDTADVSPDIIAPQITPLSGDFSWKWYVDSIGPSNPSLTVTNKSPIEQLKLTKDTTDYLWYRRSFNLTSNLPSPNVLYIGSTESSGFEVYLDGVYQTQQWDLIKGAQSVIFNISLGDLAQGSHTFDILSVSLGIENVGKQMETFQKGINGSVLLNNMNLTVGADNASFWVMQPGLIGEHLKIFTPGGFNNVTWSSTNFPSQTSSPVWFSTSFPTPQGLTGEELLSVAIDVTGLTKGHVYVNGNDIGKLNYVFDLVSLHSLFF